MPARVWGRGRCPAGSSCLAPPTAAGSLSHRHGRPAESRLCVEQLRARRAPLSRDALRWPPTPDAGLCFAPETRVRYADSARLRKRRTDRPCLDRMRQLLPYHHRVTRTDHARDSDSGPPLQAPGATDDAFSPPPPPPPPEGAHFPADRELACHGSAQRLHLRGSRLRLHSPLHRHLRRCRRRNHKQQCQFNCRISSSSSSSSSRQQAVAGSSSSSRQQQQQQAAAAAPLQSR